MKIKRIDHIVLTVADIPRALRFYHEVFDMPIISQKQTGGCVRCGHQLIEFQTPTQPQSLTAAKPTSGSAAICIVAADPVENILNHLASYYIPLVAGPLKKEGAEGQMTAIYINDYDQNLVEIASYK
ncbi:VOC family protein [Liquorilactobacillus satsumensis]|uniref:VOC family protein n=1 Tax=Liquorilactobacillus satsumensis TaxID=259059 RepID=UPI001E5A9EAE|nr:VOC family protein [Liquorilactobacillus satsumensis]MCC7666183.1 VOC family virulence protein [Liquorilactobacillus satsumensis]MCP9357450.1 VOC family protein [Liquorilactobacillus satsumensis]MCP9371278.1 VOC family protein [Liquorilactobacillus satsumensis]